MSEQDISRWQEAVTPRHAFPHPWTLGNGGSWDMMEVLPISNEMLAELAERYRHLGTPWNCRSMPLSPADREYMYLLYFSMQGLVARIRKAECELDADRLTVSHSDFEVWFQGYDMRQKGTKQLCLDAYAAGMVERKQKHSPDDPDLREEH